jgi:hypothetical protein
MHTLSDRRNERGEKNRRQIVKKKGGEREREKGRKKQ